MAHLTDRWKLIHIAALEHWSNATKQEIVMSALVTWESTTINATECVLSSSDSYIKLFKKQDIKSQNGLLKVRSVLMRCRHHWAFALQGALNAKY